MAVSKEVQILIKAKDMATGTLNNVGSSLSRLSRKVTVTKGDFIAAGAIATGLIGTIGLVGKKALGVASDFEQLGVAFEVLVGDADVAKDLLKKLVEFAAKTPFDVKGVTTAGKQLLAMGASTEDVLPELKMLGDVSAGLGVPMDRLVTNFGQVRTVGHLAGRELRDFSVAGVPLIEALTQVGTTAGKTKEEIADMVSKGLVGFDDVKLAFEKMTGAGGKFEDMMERQSETLAGSIEKVKDKIDIFLSAAVGVEATGEVREGSIFAIAKQVVDKLGDTLDMVTPKVIEFMDKLAVNKEALTVLAGIIGGLLVGAVLAVVAVIGAIPVVIVVATVAVFAAVAAIIAKFGIMKEAIFLVIKLIVNKLIIAKLDMQRPMVAAAVKIRNAWQSLKEWFFGFVDSVKAKMGEIRGLASNIRESVSGVFGFRQFGGFVTPGQPYIVGERGPELFVPSTAGRVEPNAAVATAPVTYNANVYIGMYAGTALEKRRIAEEIMKEFKYLAASRGRTVEEEIKV